MAKYRKKPVVIEAFRWNGKEVWGNLHHLPQWLGNAIAGKLSSEVGSAIFRTNFDGTVSLEIRTLEGGVIASPGDWIIRGIAGELYPCKHEIFEETYEIVVEDGPRKAVKPQRIETA